MLRPCCSLPLPLPLPLPNAVGYPNVTTGRCGWIDNPSFKGHDSGPTLSLTRTLMQAATVTVTVTVTTERFTLGVSLADGSDWGWVKR